MLAPAQALQREHLRTTDRAFSNLESHPEGFNALRRMYESVQVPHTALTSPTRDRRSTAAASCASMRSVLQ
jgi:ubiquilin